MSDSLRILVTGSRFYARPRLLADVLDGVAMGRPVVLVHGRCDPRQAWGDRDPVPWNRAMMLGRMEQRLLLGGDWQAHLHAQGRGWREEPHPANWRALKRKAGYVRNAEMVALGADMVVAAMQPGEANNGTRNCADLAAKAGIRVVWVTPEQLDSANPTHLHYT